MAGRSAALLVVLLCVLVGCSHASAPIVTVHLKGTSIKSLNDLHIGAEYDTVYKDDIRCGGTYQHNELPLLPKTLYVSTERELRGGLRGRAKATADLVARSVTVAAAAARGDGAEVTAVFDTRSKLTLLGASCRKMARGRLMLIKPELNFKDRTASLLLSRRCGGASEDEDDPESALVEVVADMADEDLTVRVTKRVDAETEVTPIWSVATGRVALECRRRTAGGGDLDLFLDPDEGLDARWRDPAAHGAWTLHARVPFRRPRASCVTVRRAWRLTPVL